MKQKVRHQVDLSISDIFAWQTLDKVLETLKDTVEQFNISGEFDHFEVSTSYDGTDLYAVGTRLETDEEESIREAKKEATMKRKEVSEKKERELYERLKKKFEGEN